MLATARLLLTGELTGADKVLEVAREAAAAGDRAAAQHLVKEVLRRHEGYPPARRLQVELDANHEGRK